MNVSSKPSLADVDAKPTWSIVEPRSLYDSRLLPFRCCDLLFPQHLPARAVTLNRIELPGIALATECESS